MQLRYAILFVSDLTRSIEFYRDLLGIRLLEETRTSAEFDAGCATLSLRIAHVDDPDHHHPPMLAGSCRLGFLVDDVKTTHDRLVASGVRCIQPPEERSQMCVALYEDPDGANFTIASPLRSAT